MFGRLHRLKKDRQGITKRKELIPLDLTNDRICQILREVDMSQNAEAGFETCKGHDAVGSLSAGRDS